MGKWYEGLKEFDTHVVKAVALFTKKEHRYNSNGDPLFAYCDGSAYCGDCTADMMRDVAFLGARDMGVTANMENAHLYCDSCSTRIESAYADEVGYHYCDEAECFELYVGRIGGICDAC